MGACPYGRTALLDRWGDPRSAVCPNTRVAGVPPLYGGEEGLEATAALCAVCRSGLYQWLDGDGGGAIPLRDEQGHGLLDGADRHQFLVEVLLSTE